MTLPEWSALPIRTKRSRRRLYAVLKGEYASLTAWKSLPLNVKRSKIHLHNYISTVLNLDKYDELNKRLYRSTRLWYLYIKANASADSPTLTITITDGTDPISSASVKIGSTTQTTNGEGKTTFSGLTYGNYDVTISKAGYYDLDDNLKFRANHKNFTLALTTLPTLTVTVTDDGETPTPISGATVTIDDVEKTTNDSGVATFKLDYDDYEASVSAEGYDTKTANIEFSATKTGATIKLTETAPSDDTEGEGEESDSVTLTILDNTYNAPVVGAVVVVYDVDESVVDPIIPAIYADNNGQVTFNIANGTYFLQVSASTYDQFGEEVTFDGNHRNLTYKLTRQY